MGDRLQAILWRWELDPPRFTPQERLRLDGGLRDWLDAQGVLSQSQPAASWDCTECGTSCPLIYVDDVQGVSRTFAACSICGPCEVDARELQRFELQTEVFLAAIFATQRLVLAAVEGGGFWKVGRATWGGHWRNVWFVRGSERETVAAARSTLASHPRACLFTPTRHTAERWARRIPGLVVALEDCLDWTDQRLVLDDEYIASQIMTTPEVTTRTAKPLPKRSVRAAKIEKLRRAMVEHVRSACAYARDSQERKGSPQLLPRPTQAYLARHTGMSTSDVCRCLKDPTAKDLKLLWEGSGDVYELMKFERVTR